MSRLIDDERRYNSDLIAELSDEIECLKTELDNVRKSYEELEAENEVLREMDFRGLREVAKVLANSKAPFRWSSLWRDCGLRQIKIGKQLLRLCEAHLQEEN